jgi:trimeric autotransporter adhesin
LFVNGFKNNLQYKLNRLFIMKKYLLLTSTLFFYELIHAQNIGIKTTTPQSTLDINGDLSLRKATLTLAAGGNNNVDISTSKYSVYDFAGGSLTGGAQIFGFSGGTDGRIVTIFNNSTTAAMQIMDESHPGSASSTAANRIITGSSNAAVIYQNGSTTLRYDGQKQRWTIIGSNYTDGLSAAPAAWLLGGNAGTNPSTNFIGTTDNIPLSFKINNQSAGKISNRNISIGITAANSATTATGNVVIGHAALNKNTINGDLVAIGDSALYNNIFAIDPMGGIYGGDGNNAVGTKALLFNTIGWNNTATGYHTLSKNTLGSKNTATGNASLFSNVNGFSNTATGDKSLYYNLAGSANTANGASALYFNAGGSYNTAFGMNALYSNTSGSYNVATGFESLNSNTIGYANTANGYQTLFSATTGSYNTGAGYQSLYYNTDGSFNSTTGVYALYKNTSGKLNTAMGSQSLFFNTVGDNNVAIGHNSLYNNIGGINNTAIGYGSLQFNVSGGNNIAIGREAGTSSSYNNTISIGNNGWLNAFHNQVFLGNASNTWIGGWVGWSIYSDGRMKKNIKEDVQGLAFIKRLRPVTYHRDIDLATTLTGNKSVADYPQKYDAEKIKTSGFVAQEVEQAAIASGYDFDGVQKPKDEKSLYAVTYASFVVPLVKAVQELSAQNETMQSEIQQLKAQNKILFQLLKNKE